MGEVYDAAEKLRDSLLDIRDGIEEVDEKLASVRWAIGLLAVTAIDAYLRTVPRPFDEDHKWLLQERENLRRAMDSRVRHPRQSGQQ